MAIIDFGRKSRAAMLSPVFFGENVCLAQPSVELKKIDKHLRRAYFCFGSSILLVGCDVCFSIKAERLNFSFQYIFFIAFLLLSLQLRVLVLALEMYALPTKLLPRERLRIRAPPQPNYPLFTAEPH